MTIIDLVHHMYSPEEANKDNTNKVNWLLYFDRKIISVIWWIHFQCKVYSGKVTSQDDTDDDKPYSRDSGS